MSRIKTEELLDRIAKGNYKVVILKAVQSNAFVMMLETESETFIHEGLDGEMKEYPKVDHALTWLMRMTNVSQIVVDVGLLRNS